MTIATYLTLLRIIVILPMILFLWLDYDWARWTALGIYTFACVTDFFDGWLARRRKEITNLGKFLDPIADKLLIAALIVMLLSLQRIDGITVGAAMIILMREIAVSGLREHLASFDVDIPVSSLAKWKTTAQMFSLGFLIVGNVPVVPFPFDHLPISVIATGEILIWAASLLTLYTGWHYLKVGIKNLQEEL